MLRRRLTSPNATYPVDRKRRANSFDAFRLLIGLCISVLFAIKSSVYATEPPFILPKQSELNKLKTVQIKTSKGELWFELFPDEAPWHVANLKYLADKGRYKGATFGHFFENFIIQVVPTKDNKSLSYTVPPEFSERKHSEGTLGMARITDASNSERRSDGFSFHIILGNAAHLDGSYTIFGQLLEGYKVLRELRNGDSIIDVQVFVK